MLTPTDPSSSDPKGDDPALGRPRDYLRAQISFTSLRDMYLGARPIRAIALYSWWGTCLACGAEPHAPDPDDADFGKHNPGCPSQEETP